MASGTADLQRDLGGALMKSIFGALLTAGYASAMSAADASDNVTDSTQAALTKSFSSAEALAQQYPSDAAAITAAATQSFLDGDQWAYTAGLVAVLAGPCSSSSCSRSTTRRSGSSPPTTPRTQEVPHEQPARDRIRRLVVQEGELAARPHDRWIMTNSRMIEIVVGLGFGVMFLYKGTVVLL